MKPEAHIRRLKRRIATCQARIAREQEDIKQHEEKIAIFAIEVERQRRQNEREVNIARGQKWQKDDPEGHAAFLSDIRERNRLGEIEGFLNGWWDLDENGRMVAPAQVFHLSDFSEVKNPLMAHVMVKIGIFPSVGQARKNGWDNPLTVGEWTLTKKKIRVKIING